MMLKKILITCITILLTTSLIFTETNASSLLNITVEGQQHYQKAYDVLELVNEERKKENLDPLVMDEDLLKAAMQRAVETSLYFDHTRPDNSSCFTVCNKMSGENIAAGNSTAIGTMNQWMNSSGHKANILKSSYQSIGIGCFQIGSVYYWVQCFGSQSSVPTIQQNSTTNFKGTIAVDKDLVQLYAYSVGDKTYADEYLVGEKGYFNYGILNQGWTMVFALGVNSDYIFESSNSNIVSINNKGEFIAKDEGSATLSIRLKEDPSISYSETITVKKEDLSDETYTCVYDLDNSYYYTGNKICPKVEVYYTLSRLLKEGVDYTITYQNNLNVGTATLIINGIGKYKGILKKNFKIVRINQNITVKEYNGTYDGIAHTITLNNVKKNSVVKYSIDNKTWVTTKPTRTKVGTTTVYYQITNPNYNTIKGSQKIVIKPQSILSLSYSKITNETYTGKAIKQKVTVKYGKRTLKSGTDYTLSYKNNKNTGKATITIKGKGNYTGSKTINFYIVPKKVIISSVKPGKKQFTVKYKKVTGASGYQIAYSTSKSKGFKYITVNAKTVSKVIKKLKSKKNYYVKVRAYKTVGKKKYYGVYSAIKSVKVK